jgi:hypothetical protein
MAAALTVGGFLLRLRDLDQPMRSDEALVFMTFVKKPLFLIVALYNDVANHVFETVLKHLSWRLFGDAEWAIRLPSFVAGCLLPPAVFLTVRGLYGRPAALLATALAAGSSALVEYSVNARGYELLALLTVLQLGLASSLARRGNPLAWTLWPLLAALGFWTHPAALLSFGIVAGWLLLALLHRPPAERRSALVAFFAMTGLGAVLTLLLYTPILVTFGQGHMAHMMARGAGDLRWSDPWGGLTLLWGVFTRTLPAPAAALLVLGLVLALWGEFRLGCRGSALWLAGLLWLGLFLAVDPMFGYWRLWLPEGLLTYLIAAAGLGWLLGLLPRSWSDRAALALAAVLFLTAAGGELRDEPVRRNDDGAFFEAKLAAALLAARLGPGDRVYAPSPAGMPLLYAWERLGKTARIITSARPDALGDPMQTFALTPEEGEGDLYLVLTASNPPPEIFLRRLTGEANPSADLVQRYPDSSIWRLPRPPGL